MNKFDPTRSAGAGDDNSGAHPGSGHPEQPVHGLGRPPQGGYPGYPGDAPQGTQPQPDPQPGYPGGAPQGSRPGYAGGQPPQGTQPVHPGQPGYPGDQGGASGWGPPTGPAGPWQQHYPPYGPGPQLPQQRPSHKGRTIGIAAGVVALSVLAGFGVGRFAWNSGGDANQSFGSVAPPGGTSSTSINAAAIAGKVDPALVDINTQLGYQNGEAAGTGIVLTANGEILTNNHVVEGATAIKVTDIGNGQTYGATVVGYDRTKDIAVLQLQNATGLTTANLGDSTKVNKGDAVVGIGNAGGTGGTPSAAAGTVTALNQSITASDESSNASEQLTGLIQTNANIQSGDSGGSLVNSAGQVIGVDTAASSGFQFGQGGSGNGGSGDGSGDGSGGVGNGGGAGSGGQDQQGQGDHQGYAIPINDAIGLAHQIIGNQGSGTVHIGQSAFLGVQVSDPGQSQQQGQGGFSQGGGQGSQGSGTQGGSGTPGGSGAQVVGVLDNGAAEQAGLGAGDVIDSVNGTAVNSATALTNLMDSFHPGDKLSVVYTDASGQQHTVTVVPASGPVG